MTRQSISISQPNEDWLQFQLEKEEFSSKSELINYLIREARKRDSELEWINQKLEKSEKSGFSSDTKLEILRKAKSRVHAGL